MWIDFAELLVDIGLIRKDIKANKEVKKKNLENSESRTKVKYVLFPSFKVYGIVSIILFALITALVLIKQAKAPSRAQEDLDEIYAAILTYQSDTGEYPESIEKLIGNRPLRKDWETDFWGHPYRYEIIVSTNVFILVSAGKDGIMDTDDDLMVSNQ